MSQDVPFYKCKTCGKRGYHSETNAYTAALSLSMRLGHGVRIYWCNVSRGWHTSSKPHKFW